MSHEADDEVQHEVGTPYEKKTMSGDNSLSPRSNSGFIMKNPSNINIMSYPEKGVGKRKTSRMRKKKRQVRMVANSASRLQLGSIDSHVQNTGTVYSSTLLPQHRNQSGAVINQSSSKVTLISLGGKNGRV